MQEHLRFDLESQMQSTHLNASLNFCSLGTSRNSLRESSSRTFPGVRAFGAAGGLPAPGCSPWRAAALPSVRGGKGGNEAAAGWEIPHAQTPLSYSGQQTKAMTEGK